MLAGRPAYLISIISYFIIAVNLTSLIPACVNYYILVYSRLRALSKLFFFIFFVLFFCQLNKMHVSVLLGVQPAELKAQVTSFFPARCPTTGSPDVYRCVCVCKVRIT